MFEIEGPGRLGWELFDSSRFQFQEQLGKGGWGTVHLALDTETGERVAIKVQTKWARSEAGKRSPSQAAVLGRIRQEGELLAHMQRSKRVVRLIHRMEDRDNAYLITEVLHGGDLELALAERRRLSEDLGEDFHAQLDMFMHGCGACLLAGALVLRLCLRRLQLLCS